MTGNNFKDDINVKNCFNCQYCQINKLTYFGICFHPSLTHQNGFKKMNLTDCHVVDYRTICDSWIERDKDDSSTRNPWW